AAGEMGGRYALSTVCEQTAIEAADGVNAVSHGVRDEVLRCYQKAKPERVHVIQNGIDPKISRPQPSKEALERLGVDPSKPFAFFNGRITRQKGLHLLLAAALKMDPRHQLVIVASSPDTPEIAAEVSQLAERVRAERGNL